MQEVTAQDLSLTENELPVWRVTNAGIQTQMAVA
jgi:hypothetical protein